MKRLLLIFLLISGFSIASAQSIYFNNRYNNDLWSAALSILETDSGYVACGVTGVLYNDYMFRKIVLTKIDDYGNPVWWKTYGENFHDYFAGDAGGCIKTSDNGYLVSGTIADSIRNVGLLIKFDQDGDSLWSRIFGDTVSLNYSSTIFNICVQLPDKDFLITGHRYISGDDADILLIRTDSMGGIIWEHTYGLLHIVEDGYSIAQLPEGEFLVGYIRQNLNSINSMDPGLIKVDSSGNLLWTKRYGGPFDDSGCSVLLSSDGNYLVGSSYAISEEPPGYPLMKVWLIKTDTSGNIIWERKYGDELFTGGCLGVIELADGSIIASGLGVFETSLTYDGWILKTEQNGDSTWMRRYRYYQDGLNYLYNLIPTSDNGIIFTGMTMGDPDWEQSIWVQKLDSLGCDSAGCDTTVGIVERRGSWGAGQLGNLMIYPNPASDWIHIIFPLNRPALSPDRQLQIFNATGEQVGEARLPMISESYDYNVSNLSQGLYLVVLKERQRVACSGKFVIAR